ncbi:M15 family metallopeptidase, partial [Patescibacteria group bacterium]|nr:M15 family metallopeptidase [Patescibacteria group bacterium]
ECFIPTAAVYGYDLRITSGFRSLSEQTQIYDQGRTIDGHIISEASAGKSIHNYGFAVDVADRERAYDINWIKLGKIGAYCGLEQGPEGDYPHFEHRGGLTTADFAAGLRPSPLSLPCPIMDVRAKANQSLTRTDLNNCGAPNFNN